MSVTTLDRVKLRLGIAAADGTQDDLLGMLIGQIDAALSNVVDCVLDSPPVEATEYYDGTGHDLLQLRRWPVTEVSEVYLDDSAAYGQAPGSFASSTLLTNGVDYAVRWDSAGVCLSGHLQRIGSVWTSREWYDDPSVLVPRKVPGAGNVKVKYKAGWTTIPADLELIAHRFVAAEYRSSDKGGPIQSESLADGGGSYSYTIAANAAAFVSAVSSGGLLAAYMRMRF